LPENLTTYIVQQSVDCTQMLPNNCKTSADYCCEYRARKKIRENSVNPELTCSRSIDIQAEIQRENSPLNLPKK